MRKFAEALSCCTLEILFNQLVIVHNLTTWQPRYFDLNALILVTITYCLSSDFHRRNMPFLDRNNKQTNKQTNKQVSVVK